MTSRVDRELHPGVALIRPHARIRQLSDVEESLEPADVDDTTSQYGNVDLVPLCTFWIPSLPWAWYQSRRWLLLDSH